MAGLTLSVTEMLAGIGCSRPLNENDTTQSAGLSGLVFGD